MIHAPKRWSSVLHRSWLSHYTTVFCLMSFIMGGLLTGCASTRADTQTAPLPQQQITTQEAVDNTSGSETVEVVARLGVIVDASMKVVDVMSQSPAERGGVQVGDILQSFDELFFAKEGEKIIDKLNREVRSKENVHRLIVLRADKELQLAFDLTAVETYVPPSPLPTPVPADSGLMLY